MENLRETILHKIVNTREKYFCQDVDIYIDTHGFRELRTYLEHYIHCDENGVYRFMGCKVYPVLASGHFKVYPSR